MAASRDPREIITPDAFSVAPELLGLPLAHPWRRAAAMLVDLALVGLLSTASWVFLALAVGVGFFWMATRGRKGTKSGAFGRGVLGCLGAIALFVAVLAIVGPRLADENTPLVTLSGPGGERVPVSLGMLGDIRDIAEADDSSEAVAAARSLVERLERGGMSPEEILSAARATAEGDSAAVGFVERALAPVTEQTAPASPETPLDSLLSRLVAARTAGDTAVAASLEEALGGRLAAPQLERRDRRIESLEGQNRRLQTSVEETEAALDAERNVGIRRLVTNLLDEFGIGIGWTAVYFTLALGLFRGRTPGKRLLGTRVVRLDGEPLSLWAAFERYGGYAASIATGFEGFLRILWDANRQGLEDKLAETVVVRETPETHERLLRLGIAGRGRRSGSGAEEAKRGTAPAHGSPS